MANKKISKSTAKKLSTKKQAENLANAQLQAKFGETIESAEKIVEERKKEERNINEFRKSSRLDWEERYPGITEQDSTAIRKPNCHPVRIVVSTIWEVCRSDLLVA